MKLPEAIALMLEGKVMVDANGYLHRADQWEGEGVVEFEFRVDRDWCWSTGATHFQVTGWREATPEELKEIGL